MLVAVCALWWHLIGMADMPLLALAEAHAQQMPPMGFEPMTLGS